MKSKLFCNTIDWANPENVLIQNQLKCAGWKRSFTGDFKNNPVKVFWGSCIVYHCNTIAQQTQFSKRFALLFWKWVFCFCFYLYFLNCGKLLYTNFDHLSTQHGLLVLAIIHRDTIPSCIWKFPRIRSDSFCMKIMYIAIELQPFSYLICNMSFIYLLVCYIV